MATRIVGRRQSSPTIVATASAAALRSGLAVVDAAATFGWATSTDQRKGVYRFSSFEAMEEHRIDVWRRLLPRVPVPRVHE